jgi:MYXO-CTERM domain-containing protein
MKNALEKRAGMIMGRRMVKGTIGATWAVLMLAGCMVDDQIGKTEAALSHPGPWDIPASTIAIGDTQWVENTQAGPWVGTSGCSGGITSGAQVLKDWLLGAYPQIRSIGGYSCRAIVGAESVMSVHGTGRALDIMLPLHAGDADNDLGDPIGNYLIEHAEEIGIQYIIWDRWSWNASRAAGTKERMYGGTHPHHDHLHVEVSVEASRMGTPWFTSPMEPPSLDGCDAIPVAGGTVDNSSPCFAAYGPATYWRNEAGVGEGGSLTWTNAFSNDTPSNWARWHLNVGEAGEYAVEVSVDPAFGVYNAVRYGVSHDGAEELVTADQSASDGWIRLGIFHFAAGAGQHISVFDNYTGTVPPEQHIVADAVRLVPDAPGMEPTDPGVEPTDPPPVMEPGPMPDGDPTIDDDPMITDDLYYGRGDGTVTGGCAVSTTRDAGASTGPVLAALALLAAGLRRRRT